MQRRSIGAFLVFTGAIVLCLWMGYEYSHRQSRSVAGSATELRPQPTQQILSATPSSIAAPSPSVETSGRTKEERMSQILEATSHQPIDFYGRVVDQTGAPVADADIRGNVEISRRWMDQTWEEHHTITDADGRFSFSGLHGQNLVVTPRKDGYSYKEATKDVFAYSALSPERERHKPDTSDPVVFTMWKQKGPEPLVHTRMDRIPVPVDGTIVTIDLLTAKKVQDHGDLSVKLERDPQHITRGKPFSWKAVIAVPDGGLIATHDEYANEAPANGYRPAVEFNMLPAAPDWHSSIRETYYAKLRNGGAFARITIRITADYEPPPTGVTIEAFVNPSGSRNLEFDPTKVIRR